jgi:hypothetical protein
MASRVHPAINSRTSEKAHRISLVTARRVIASYDPSLVERTLKRLARRSNLTKPVGFFMTLLRGEQKFGRAG